MIDDPAKRATTFAAPRPLPRGEQDRAVEATGRAVAVGCLLVGFGVALVAVSAVLVAALWFALGVAFDVVAAAPRFVSGG